MRRKNKRINWFRLAIVLIGCYFLYVLCGQWITMYQLWSETQTTQKVVEQLEQKNQELLQKKENLNNPEIIEKMAREELGMVKPGEMPYIKDKAKQ